MEYVEQHLGYSSYHSRRTWLIRACQLSFVATSLTLQLSFWAVPALGVVTIEQLGGTVSVPPQVPSPSSTGSPIQDSIFNSPMIYNLRLGASPPVEVFGAYGGEPVAQFVGGSVGSDGSLPKKLSGYEYRDIVFYYLPAPGNSINAWLADSMKGTAPAVTGSLVIGNRINQDVSILSFTQAFVREISFPEGTVAPSPDPAPIRITLAAQRINRSPGGKTLSAMAHASLMNVPMKSLFEISINDTNQTGPTSHVEPLAVSFTLLQAANGGGYRGSTPRDISTVRFQLPESNASGFYTWLNSFVLGGQNSDVQERNGTVRWLSPQAPSTALLTLELHHLGILSIIHLPSKPGYVQVELYCERIVPFFP